MDAMVSHPRWSRRGLAFRLVLLIGVGAGGGYGLGGLWMHQSLLAAVNWLGTGFFAVTALLLADEPGQRSNAWLFAGASLTWTLGYLGDGQPVGPLPLLEWVAGPLVFGLLAAVLLRYPERRLVLRHERWFVLLLFVWLLLTRSAMAVTSRPQWLGFGSGAWWPAWFPSQSVSDMLSLAFDVLAAFLLAAFAILIGRRLRRSYAIDRHVLTPVVTAASAGALAVAADVISRLLPVTWPLLTIVLGIEAAAMLAIPAAFLVATVRSRMARGAVADLILAISGPGNAELVRSEIRRVLCDPTLDILYLVPGLDEYVDGDGRSAELQSASQGRLVVPVALAADQPPLAAVIVDPSLARHGDLLNGAVAASALALDNARLQANVRAQLEQLRVARTRVAEARMAERRRVERDLHDGAQQQLLALTLQLSSVGALTKDRAAQSAIAQAEVQLRNALDELRDLAHGIFPVVLTVLGLGPAIREVAERLPLPVEVDVPAQRWDEVVETTIYFLVCEALSNTVKYGEATFANVNVRSEVGELSVEVADDGIGGAALTPGGGLDGLLDRVLAVDGKMSITSTSGAGTRIFATIPCSRAPHTARAG